MALLIIQNNKYIRLLPGGNYEIWSSEESRNVTKLSPSIEDVKKSYENKIEALRKKFYTYLESTVDIETLQIKNEAHIESIINSDSVLKEAYNELRLWIDEYDKYKKSVHFSEVSLEESFPLGETLISNIKGSIPSIQETGRLGMFSKEDSVEEIYNKVKSFEIFGETKDI